MSYEQAPTPAPGHAEFRPLEEQELPEPQPEASGTGLPPESGDGYDFPKAPNQFEGIDNRMPPEVHEQLRKTVAEHSGDSVSNVI